MKINLQEQLIDTLTNYIQTLPSNTRLPSERQLADKYEVSRNTIRCALMNMEVTGLIRRIHGKGTFVNRVNLNSDLGSNFQFGEQMRQLGKVPRTEVISFEKRDVNAYFAQSMNLKLGEEVIKIERLRLADEQPMMLERSFLPLKIFPTLTKEMLQEKTMYSVFQERFDEKISYADEYFLASVISHVDSELMGIMEGTPCLNLKRTTYDQHQRVIEFTLSVARCDEFAYHIRHKLIDK